jgi:adenosine deaminase
MYLDLHVHLRGTLTSSTMRRLAARNAVPPPERVVRGETYAWRGFSSFLRVYDTVASVISTARDLEEVAYEYLVSVGLDGTAYVEFMLSPPDLMRSGVAYLDQLAALDTAALMAREVCGIECRLIVTAVRHLGGAAAIEAARLAISQQHRLVVAFGLTGDERKFHIRDFEEAFRVARAGGLGATAHVGEHLGPDTIIEAADRLRLDRVGHGVRAIESSAVTRQLAQEGIPLEVCLSSNLALGLYRQPGDHPIRRLAAAGCTIVLGTDDPAFFNTSPKHEHQLATSLLQGIATTQQLAQKSVAAAFCDEVTKGFLFDRIASEP